MPRKATVLLFAAVLLCGLIATGCSDDRSDNPIAPLGSEIGRLNPPIAALAAPAGYYDDANASTPAALRASLHEIIDDHQKIPYTSTATDTWDVLEAADEDPADSGRILDLYMNASYPKYGEGNTDYNREHAWAKSYGFPNDGSSNYPYTDCHHLFLCNDSYNTSRSNKPFRYCASGCDEKPTEVNDGAGGGTGVYPGNSNWTSGQLTDGTWEVWTGRRGDVARALFYMDVRYEGGDHGVTGYEEPDLILTDDQGLIAASNTGSNESIAYMGMLSVLLEWHQQDPVDAKELARNDAVFAEQGNRNPFIDHPEWVACVFQGDCGGGDTTPPATPTGLAAVGGQNVVTLDWDDNGESDLAGYDVYRATVSGGSYSKINASTLTSSDFVDGGVAGGVTYYYVVTASDTSNNESAQSAEASATPTGGSGGDPAAWINEFHYDNDGTDTGEFFEIAGTAGLDLTGWKIYGYNGNGGVVYDTETLSGTLPDLQNGFGVLDFAMAGMQNGSPDGLALVDDGGGVVQFISYEGVINATDGPAAGTASTDIGVSEPADSPVGWSLQLAGDGSAAADFAWQAPQAETRGAVNAGQSFEGTGPANQAPVAEANGPYSGSAGTAVTFSSSGSYDPDGTISGWHWDFGDGATSTEQNPSHVFDEAGSYTVTLTVTDDMDATGEDTAAANIIDTTPPAAPTGLSAAAGNGSVDLDWNDNGEADLEGYFVYRSTTSGGPYDQINPSVLTASAFTDDTVTNDVTYHYVVTAIDRTGNEGDVGAEVSATPTAPVTGGDAWINEFHYDNDGADKNEFVEVAAPAGTDLGGWHVYGYNGADGTVYDTVALSGVIADMQGGYGVLAFAMVGMQNGSPDGLALVDGAGAVVQFLSYEGSFTAADGPAAGLASEDIGIYEPVDAPRRTSLQLAGAGTAYADFWWQGPLGKTDGAVNENQTLGSGGGDVTAPAAPAGLDATAGDSVVDLDWNDNGESDLDGYNVYRAASAGGPYSQLNGSPLAASLYSDAAANNGTTYWYVATAVDLTGNESAYSAEVSATPAGGGASTAVHVAAISLGVFSAGPKEYGRAVVTIVDDQGAPVAGATVTGTFTGGTSGTAVATTAADGTAVLDSAKGGKVGLSYTFCVDDVSGTDMSYDAGANVVTCDSW